MPDAQGRIADTAEFLRPAERYQLMPQIDRWVVNATLAGYVGGEIKMPSGRSCAINLSGQTLGDESFLGFVVDSLDRTGMSPSSICFEVTENCDPVERATCAALHRGSARHRLRIFAG